MKQITIKIAFFSFLLAPFFVSYFALNLRKAEIKKSVKHMLMHSVDKEELVHFTFSKSFVKNELRWEKDHEFEFNGKMFDIVEQHVTEDSITYICWLDKEETKLNAQLATLTQLSFLKDSKRKNCESSILYLVKSLYLPPLKFEETTFPLSIKKQHFRYQRKTICRNQEPLLPPPSLRLT